MLNCCYPLNRFLEVASLLFCAFLFVILEQNLPLNANVYCPILPIAFTFFSKLNHICCRMRTDFAERSKVVFWKIRCFFRKKLSFLKIAKGSQFAIECASNPNISLIFFSPNYECFRLTVRIFLKLEKLENMKNERFFLKKIFIFLKAVFTKMGRRKMSR